MCHGSDTPLEGSGAERLSRVHKQICSHLEASHWMWQQARQTASNASTYLGSKSTYIKDLHHVDSEQQSLNTAPTQFSLAISTAVLVLPPSSLQAHCTNQIAPLQGLAWCGAAPRLAERLRRSSGVPERTREDLKESERTSGGTCSRGPSLLLPYWSRA